MMKSIKRFIGHALLLAGMGIFVLCICLGIRDGWEQLSIYHDWWDAFFAFTNWFWGGLFFAMFLGSFSENDKPLTVEDLFWPDPVHPMAPKSLKSPLQKEKQ